MNWLIIALIPPALYAVSNFFDKFLVEKRVKDPYVLVVIAGAISFVTGLIILFVRGFPLLLNTQIILLLTAGTLGELGLIPYLKALKLDDASRVVPLFRLIPVFVLILSALLLGEVLNLAQYVGFIIILIASIVVSLKKLSLSFLRLRKSFWYMVLSSIMFAFWIVLFRFVVVESNFWDTLGWELLGGGIGALLIFTFYRKAIIITYMKRDTFALVITNETIYVGARLLAFYAISLVSATLVTIVESTQPLFVLVYGLILSRWYPSVIKEDTKANVIILKLTAAVFMIIGIGLLVR
jgi:uncharacterized membrane protein